MDKIRNFCIIAHIDHGKSTLADRMLEITGTIKASKNSQVLDKLELEQERGITIKLTPARMQWKWYELNLIDTPWHVDFQYEVSRSLAACQWVVLLVDASQGIQAQTLSTLYMAIDYGMEIIPVLNKIDLPAANPERVGAEIEKLLWIPVADIIKVSGKTGENVSSVLDEIVSKVPAPVPLSLHNSQLWITNSQLSRCLIFDSVFDPYKWVVAYVQVVNGEFKAGQTVHAIHSETALSITEVGHFAPNYVVDPKLSQGQIWYIVTWQKSVREIQIGDTVISKVEQKENYAIWGFKKIKPYVYAWVYPMSNDEFDKLRDAFERLALNDSAIEYEYENNKALWFGFRCGFLGMLHMDIVKERLIREHKIETIFTIPNVVYLVQSKQTNLEDIKSGKNLIDLARTGMWKYIAQHEKRDDVNELTDLEDHLLIEAIAVRCKRWLIVRSGWDMIPNWLVETMLEPMTDIEVVWPADYYGNISKLCQEYRGQLKSTEYINDRVLWKYRIPLGEIIIDFYDQLKSLTRWYATMNYEFVGYEESDLDKVDILINGELAESFSMIVHSSKAYSTGSDIVTRLKELIPKHLFAIPLQAAIGSKIIARETISAIKKDVIAKCYGWDISRKRKLLEQQKEWKKKMKEFGRVSVPNDIFIKMVTR
jgi:GTP-binding protein LepA